MSYSIKKRLIQVLGGLIVYATIGLIGVNTAWAIRGFCIVGFYIGSGITIGAVTGSLIGLATGFFPGSGVRVISSCSVSISAGTMGGGITGYLIDGIDYYMYPIDWVNFDTMINMMLMTGIISFILLGYIVYFAAYNYLATRHTIQTYRLI